MLTDPGRSAAELTNLLRSVDLAQSVPHLRECLYIVPSTVCNLRCRFCAYEKATLGRRVMPNDLFTEVVEKAVDYGFHLFGLTPMLGEALTDPRFLEKLSLLECHPGVSGYSFCTNFTLADGEFVEAIRRNRKLRWMAISVYGHDHASFGRITGAAPSLFDDFLLNLRWLVNWPEAADHVELRIRSTGDLRLDTCTTELGELVRDLASRGIRVRVPSQSYTNWGGIIREEDVQALGISLKPESPKGTPPCVFLLHKPTVLPDGSLNACYTGDANATMVIGDLSRQSFRQIYSLENEAYVALLKSHLRREFGAACRGCTAYRSVESWHYAYEFYERPFWTLGNFFEELGVGTPEARADSPKA